MDSNFEICITCKFSDFAIRSLLSAGGPYMPGKDLDQHAHLHSLISFLWML